MIEARDLAIGYGDTVLMERLNFTVEKGDVFIILGGSGCGKSTLLRTLIGLQPTLNGKIYVRGAEQGGLLDGPPQFGTMFQSGALFGSMSLIENVALPLRAWTELPEDALLSIASARLRLVGLGGFDHHAPSEISGGMKKRAGIARALALDPDLLFLDEPSAGLDPVSAAELDDLILTLSKDLGVTTILVTHELESIFKIAKRCIMLDRGAKTIIADGDPRTLRDESSDDRVSDFFNRRARSVGV